MIEQIIKFEQIQKFNGTKLKDNTIAIMFAQCLHIIELLSKNSKTITYSASQWVSLAI